MFQKFTGLFIFITAICVTPKAHAITYVYYYHPTPIICTCPGTIAANCTSVSDWTCVSRMNSHPTDAELNLAKESSTDIWTSKAIRSATKDIRKNAPRNEPPAETSQVAAQRLEEYVQASSPLLERLFNENPDGAPVQVFHTDERGQVDKALLYQE